ELNGSEDLTIEGQVEGTIQLRDHVLTIGPNGRIKAQVFAKSVVVLGEVTGNVTASDKVDIRDNGSVDGDIIAPRVAIAEGELFRGTARLQDLRRGSLRGHRSSRSQPHRRCAAGLSRTAFPPGRCQRRRDSLLGPARLSRSCVSAEAGGGAHARPAATRRAAW